MAAKAVVIGDSHVVALEKALAGMPSEYRAGFEIHRLRSKYDTDPDRTITKCDVAAIVQRMGERDILAIRNQGTAHNIFGLLRHEVPYGVCTELSPASDDVNVAEWIPHNTMKRMFLHFIAKGDVLAGLDDMPSRLVCLIPPPPPKGHAEFVSSRVKSYRGQSTDEHEVAAPQFRKSLWEIELAVMEEFSTSRGMQLVWPPKAGIDADGFLATQCYANDATHANASYGKLVLEQLSELKDRPG